MVWLKRNYLGLITLVIAAALSWFVFWLSYLVPEVDRYQAHAPIPIASGDTATFGGAQFTILGVESKNTYQDLSALPDGTTLVLVRAEIDAGTAESPYCELWWPPAEDLLSFGLDDRLAGTDSLGCLGTSLSDTGTAYQLRWAFLVPTSSWSRADASVEVIVFDELPDYLRMALGVSR